MDERTTEQLETIAQKQEQETEKEPYVSHTRLQRILALAALALVLIGLAGTIYWMITFVP